jgi:hypothetical protein
MSCTHTSHPRRTVGSHAAKLALAEAECRKAKIRDHNLVRFGVIENIAGMEVPMRQLVLVHEGKRLGARETLRKQGKLTNPKHLPAKQLHTLERLRVHLNTPRFEQFEREQTVAAVKFGVQQLGYARNASA